VLKPEIRRQAEVTIAIIIM